MVSLEVETKFKAKSKNLKFVCFLWEVMPQVQYLRRGVGRGWGAAAQL